MADQLYPTFTAPIDMQPDPEAVAPDLETIHFDFDKLEVVMRGYGKPDVLTGIETYRQWVIKCVLTARYKYLAYDDDYGVEIEEIMGEGHHPGVAVSEIKRTIVEALKVDPRTVDVNSIQVTGQGDAYHFDITVESIYGTETIYIRG